MIHTWYVPSWSGDFRLIKEGDEKCRLIVSDPTPAEVERLGRFLRAIRGRGWIPELAGVREKGNSELVIGASIVDAGRVLLGRRGKASKQDGLLTAVRCSDGAVSAEHFEGKVETALAKPEAEKAVTTRRPTLCCPSPVKGPDERASEVLQAFCTRKQWEDWQTRALLFCRGNLSGHLYRVVHRHAPLAIEQGKSVWDMTDDCVVHAYDWSVPPAEEVLALKNTLEFRENWVRNASGMLGSMRSRYPNPFVGASRQASDGLKDAAFVEGLGMGLRMWVDPTKKQ